MLLLIPAALAAAPPTTAQLIACLLGFLLWAAAYWLIISKGFKDRTYGVPLVSICLNVTWELYFAVLCPLANGRTKGICTAVGPQLLGLRIWLLLDLVILWQLLRYGWRQPFTALLSPYRDPKNRWRYFILMVLGLLMLALFWQYAFLVVTKDQDGNELAWVTNLLMSILFVRSAVTRPDRLGLSYGAAWAKLFANLAFMVFAVLNHFTVFTDWPPEVIASLMFGVFLFDIAYVVVLRAKQWPPAFAA